jgi:hypothetical protein
MSGWKIIVCDLHAAGGGPLPRSKFDRHYAGGLKDYAFQRATALGLIEARNMGYCWYWTLTKLGHDWIDGTVQIVERKTGRTGRSKVVVGATWLAPLMQQMEAST